MAGRFDTAAENEIATAFLSKRGGSFQKLTADKYANHDRLWYDARPSGSHYTFVECRWRQSYTWTNLKKFNGVRINASKLDNVFLFAVRDMGGEIRVANISPERLVQLRSSSMSKMNDQGGCPQLGVDVPYEWFEPL